MSDQESQKDEICVLESIYNDEEFRSTVEDNCISGQFDAFVKVPENFAIVFRDHSNTADVEKRLPLNYLPPISLIFKLPANYPSKSPPEFQISCTWLPFYMLRVLVDKLDKLWLENVGSVILYIWTEFLKEESFDYLKIGERFDVSRRYMADVRRAQIAWKGGGAERATRSQGQYKRYNNELCQQDPYALRITTLPLNIHLCDYLRKYNEDRAKTEFGRKIFRCGICFQDKFGIKCVQFKPCDHVYCRECVTEYFEVRIREGTIKTMPCPYEKCSSEASQHQIRELMGPKLFAHYDSMLLSITLDTMSDITYCPRVACQCPVMRETDEKMGVCPSCRYVFCVYCKMTYHGVEPCRFKAEEKKALVLEYRNGDDETKARLEARYGKRELLALLQSSMSEEWISENSKPCPSCSAAIEKSDGCNKMACWKCNTFFCWLCGSTLNPGAPYEHFYNPASKCNNLLFQGMVVGDEAEGFLLEELLDDNEDDDYYEDEIEDEEDIFFSEESSEELYVDLVI